MTSKKKKRDRPVVTLQALPRGGRYQICYFRLAFGNYFHPNWNEMFLGPYLYDIDYGRIVPFDEYKLDISVFKPGDPDNYMYHWKPVSRIKPGDGADKYGMVTEKGFTHDVAFGILHPFYGTYYSASRGTMPCTTPFSGTISYTRTRLLSMDPDGTRLQFLRVYGKGSSTPSTYSSPVYVLNMRQHAVGPGGSPTRLSVWSGCSYESTFSDISSIKLSATIPVVLNLSAQGTVQIFCTYQTWSKQSGTQNSTAVQTATPIFVSPVLASSISKSTRTYSFLNAVRFKIGQDLASVAAIKPTDCHYLACEKAVESLRITTVNSISFVKELFEIKQLVEPIIKLLRRPFSIKNWTSLILSWKYGWKLSWQDSKNLTSSFLRIKRNFRALKDYAKFRNNLKTVYGTHNWPFNIEGISSDLPGISRTNCRIVARWEIPTKATWLESLMALVEDMGLRLNATNFWDMIPYSFVLDWFCDYGQFAKQWDYYCEVDKLRLRERIKSIRNEVKTSEINYYESLGLIGSITLRSYSREPSPEFPRPPFKLGAPSWQKHYFEGTLLSLSRILKR